MMILSCDPPRHAFLVHFGKRQQPPSIQTLTFGYDGARVEIAVESQSAPPCLVAIHFVRHGFRLPFVGSTDEFSTHHFHLQFGRHQNRCFFHFDYEPRDCQEWHVHPGLTVLVSGHPQPGTGSPPSVKARPVLHGLVVNTDVLGVNVDMNEFVFEFGADHLKDVSVSLFIERERT